MIILPFCGECGQEYQQDTKFCSQCGSPLIEIQKESIHTSDDYIESLERSNFSQQGYLQQLKKILGYKTNSELKEIASSNQIELTKGLILKKKLENRDEVIQKIIESDMDFDFLYNELEARYQNTPFNDARPETIRMFNLLYDNLKKDLGYLSNSELCKGDWVYLYTNKVDMLLYREKFLLSLRDREPDNIVKGFTVQNQRLAAKIPYITIEDNTHSTDNVVKALISLGREKIRVYSNGTSTYFMNEMEEVLRIESGEEKPTGLTLKHITATEPQSLDLGKEIEEVIQVIDEVDLLDEYHNLEAQKTEDATFPSNVDTLIRAWRREIDYWQETYIEYMDLERKAWERVKRSEKVNPEVFTLIHTLQVNLSYRISERRKNIENYKCQLSEMIAYKTDSDPVHHHKINSLLEEDLKWSKAKRRLMNDYSEILINLVKLGLDLPFRNIPPIKPINEEDYELSNYIIKQVLVVAPPMIQESYDPNYIPYITEYEEYRKSLKSYDEKLAIMDQISAPADFYMDMTKRIREEKYSIKSI
jgi:hypothetical protein